MDLGAVVTCTLWTLLVVGAGAIPRDHRRDRMVIGLIAFSARVVMLIAITAYLRSIDRAWLFPDEWVYLTEARRAMTGLTSGYPYANWLAELFDLIGYEPWVARYLNTVTGAALAMIVYELGHRVAGVRAARMAGLAVALWPSLILWSALALKDPLVLTGLASTLVGAAVARQGRWMGVAAIVGGGLLVESTRPWAFSVLSLALGGALAIGAWRVRSRALTPFAVGVLALGLVGLVRGQGFLGTAYVSSALTGEQIMHARTGSAEGETAIADAPGSVGEAFLRAPQVGLLNLIAPFPWQPVGAAGRALVIAEIVVWYPALALAVAGAVRLRRAGHEPLWVPLLLFAVGVVLVLSIYQGNAGSGLRQRAMVFPSVVLLAASFLVSQDHRLGSKDSLPRTI